MKILELTNYSAGICGVWNRVREESIRLSRLGYEVRIFSSNIEKGTNNIAEQEERCGDILIKRFPSRKLGGESFMKWNFEKEALDFSPDVIIAHNYRHLHTTIALKVKEKLEAQGKKCKVFLVTHAPFVPDNSTRDIISKLVVNLYDKFIGRRTLSKFDKIITISQWETPYILKYGATKKSLTYIPNGIPEEFFKLKKQAKEEHKILFLGRISPIKDLETLIKSLKSIKDKRILLEIVGPAEEFYKSKLLELIKSEEVEKRVIFSKPVYDIYRKIKKIDSSKIFVLPSKKEGMPQSLVEAMARGKIVIGSNIPAIKDLISDKKNGYLFEQGNEKDLVKVINYVLSKNNSLIKHNANNSVRQFSWNIIIKKIGGLF